MTTLTQQNLVTKGKIKLHSITDVNIKVAKNEHAKMIIRGIAQDDPELGDITDQLLSRNVDSEFTLCRYEDEKETPVFSGLVETVQLINKRGIDYFEVEVISGTILFDREKKKRSFQNVSMTYEAVIKQIVSEYNGGATICTVGENTPIGTPLLQYDETDWQFIKRLASHFDSIIYSEYTDSDSRVWFGFPNTMRTVDVTQTSCKYGQDELYYQLNHSYEPMDFRFVEIQSEYQFEIGDYVEFKRKGYKLYEKYGKIEKGELVFTYRFGSAGLMHFPKFHNEIISGMSLLGEVAKDEKEDIYVKLDIDGGTGGTYPYPFRPETGNMMYCMPQVGTKISLYFPNFDEKNAMVVNCFRTNGDDSPDMADTSKRAFSTEHGKSMTLHPTSMGLISQGGSHLMLDDITGFNLKSAQKLSIYGRGIEFDAPKINLKSPLGEINMMKVDTEFSTVYGSIVMCNQFDIIAKNGTRVTGTFVAYFEPFDDAPTEQGFNWGGLWGNVLAGLAVVAVVAVVAAAVIVTGGAALGVVVAAATVVKATVGIGALYVGMVAAQDYFSGEVSDVGTYMMAGLKGAVTGALFVAVGVLGQAAGTLKFLQCTKPLGELIKVTAKVSEKLAVALGGFDITSFVAGMFVPGNWYTELNQKLNSNKLYAGFVFAVDMVAIFTGSASSTMKCFVAGTTILTPRGLIAIENIKADDKVISTNIDAFEVAEKNVAQTFIRETNELVHLTINGELIQTTPEHPFYVKDHGFVNAGELQIGDELLNPTGNVLIVEETMLEVCVPSVTVYNFEVEDFHTYHVTDLGVLVHNADYDIDMPTAFQQDEFATTYTNRINQTPSLRNKIVQFIGDRGESLCRLKPPPNQELKKLFDSIPTKGINYKNGVPDFSLLAVVELKLKNMYGGLGRKFGTKARNINFAQADEALLKLVNSDSNFAKQLGLPFGGTTKKMIQNFRKNNKLTWHELNDCQTVQLVPRKVNSTFGHIGGVGEINAGAFELGNFMNK